MRTAEGVDPLQSRDQIRVPREHAGSGTVAVRCVVEAGENLDGHDLGPGTGEHRAHHRAGHAVERRGLDFIERQHRQVGDVGQYVKPDDKGGAECQ